MSFDEIMREVDSLDKEFLSLKQDLAKICWYMRGSVTWDESYSLSLEDRTIIAEIVKENLETTKKTGMPFF